MGNFLKKDKSVIYDNKVLTNSPHFLLPIVRAYESRFRQHGCKPKGVFWKSAELQQLRYGILVGVFDSIAFVGNLIIHDFGCGYGAFFDYLSNHPAMRASRYVGTDMCKDMVEAAQSRIDDARANFTNCLWATEKADYTFVSGTFNMKLNADNGLWSQYTRASLIQLWQHTRTGLAFNLLNISTPSKYDGLYYAIPEDYLEFVRTKMDPEAELVIKSPLPDFTILARRSNDS